MKLDFGSVLGGFYIKGMNDDILNSGGMHVPFLLPMEETMVDECWQSVGIASDVVVGFIKIIITITETIILLYCSIAVLGVLPTPYYTHSQTILFATYL